MGFQKLKTQLDASPWPSSVSKALTPHPALSFPDHICVFYHPCPVSLQFLTLLNLLFQMCFLNANLLQTHPGNHNGCRSGCSALSLLISHVGKSNTGLASAATRMPCPLFPLSGEIVKHPLRFFCKPHLSILISDISELWGLTARSYPAFCSYVPFSCVCPVCLGRWKLPGVRINSPSSPTQHNAMTVTDDQLMMAEFARVKIHCSSQVSTDEAMIFLHCLTQFFFFFFSLHLMQEIILLRSK